MRFPTIDQYSDALGQPQLFTRTLADCALPLRPDGFAHYNSGNFGVVFRLDSPRGPFALKCFTRRQWGRSAAYERLTDSLPNSPYLLGLRYLAGEVLVAPFGQDTLLGYDAIAMDYVDGMTLSDTIANAVATGDSAILGTLSERFDQMALWLLDTDFAHGDIKPDNVMVTGDLQLFLVDYDGAYVPSMRGECQRECGTEGYQHPLRSTANFDRHLDDYSLVLLCVTLRVLAVDVDVFLRYCSSASQAIVEPSEAVFGTSDALSYLLDLEIVDRELLLALRSPGPVINGLRGMISRSMNCVKPNENAAPQPYSCGGLSGYRTAGGEVLVEACYDSAGPFLGGVAVVSAGGHYGAIDLNGRLCVPLEWERMWDFAPQEGLALVRRGGHYGFVDRTGTERIIVGYDYAAPFSEGLAVVAVGDNYGYINSAGEVLGALEFDFARPVRGGLCRVDYRGCALELSPQELHSGDFAIEFAVDSGDSDY